MFIHPQFDPVAISIGSLSIHWYGLMYLLGFVAFIILARKRLCWFPAIRLEDVDNLLTFAVIGVILGGRLGYVLFYKPAYYMTNPLEILAIWEGGMSFHGGFLGVLLTCYAYARYKQWHFLDLTDFVAPAVPIGLALGRLGNFINGELWGRPTDSFLGVIFPQAGDLLARHPSQLYQMFLEGFLLFVVLWVFASKPRPRGAVSSLFLIGYGLTRFVAEFAREPDRFLGTLSLGLTMGQWLCLPMLVAGFWLWRYSQNQSPAWFSMNGGVGLQKSVSNPETNASSTFLMASSEEAFNHAAQVQKRPSRHSDLVQKVFKAMGAISIFGQKQKRETFEQVSEQKPILESTAHSIDLSDESSVQSTENQVDAVSAKTTKTQLKPSQAKITEAPSLKNIAAQKTISPISVKTNKRAQTGSSKSANVVEAQAAEKKSAVIESIQSKPTGQKPSEPIKTSANEPVKPTAIPNLAPQKTPASKAKQNSLRVKSKESNASLVNKNEQPTSLTQDSQPLSELKVDQPQKNLSLSQPEVQTALTPNQPNAKPRKNMKVQGSATKQAGSKKNIDDTPKKDES